MSRVILILTLLLLEWPMLQSYSDTDPTAHGMANAPVVLILTLLHLEWPMLQSCSDTDPTALGMANAPELF